MCEENVQDVKRLLIDNLAAGMLDEYYFDCPDAKYFADEVATALLKDKYSVKECYQALQLLEVSKVIAHIAGQGADSKLVVWDKAKTELLIEELSA